MNVIKHAALAAALSVVGSVGFAQAVNPAQLALLRWYPENTSGIVIPVANALGIAFDGANMWVTSASNTLTKIRAADNVVLGTYTASGFPTGIAFDGTNMWVTNQGTNTVSKFRVSDGVLQGSYATGTRPYGIAYDGAFMWTTNYNSNSVTKIRVSDGALAGNYPVGAGPTGIAFDGSSIWVANTTTATVSRLSPGTGAVIGTYSVGAARAIVFDDSSIWVGGASQVTRLRASDGALLGTTTVGNFVYSLAFDGTYVWTVNLNDRTLTRILASTGAVVDTISAPGGGGNWLAFDGANMWTTVSTGVAKM